MPDQLRLRDIFRQHSDKGNNFFYQKECFHAFDESHCAYIFFVSVIRSNLHDINEISPFPSSVFVAVISSVKATKRRCAFVGVGILFWTGQA